MTAAHSSSASTVPLNWEERSGGETSADAWNGEFEFDFSGQLDRISLTAEELFEDGKIRPFKPPPRLQLTDHQRKSSDPFSSAIEETRKRPLTGDPRPNPSLDFDQKRGRETELSSPSSYRRKASRSLSPFRVSDNWTRRTTTPSSPPSPSPSACSSFLSSLPSSRGYRKWRLKDFFLFRSASEGRGNPLRNYRVFRTKDEVEEDGKNSSFRSTESSSVAIRKGRASPQEAHYHLNRTVSEELKRKTPLPYKHGLFACLGFHSGMHEIARGIGSLTRG